MGEHDEAVRRRFGATATRVAALQDERSGPLEAEVRRFVETRGDERALDAGAGAGALAFALAPLVREVVAIDLVPELLAEGRARAPQNVTFAEGDITALPFESGSFDLVGSLRTIHHVARPELAIAELARVTRPGGRLLVIDQIAPADPLVGLELDRFERARDASHARLLPDGDLRALFEANGLVLRRSRETAERKDLERYLEHAGCEGEDRERARILAPAGDDYVVAVGWYLLAKPAG